MNDNERSPKEIIYNIMTSIDNKSIDRFTRSTILLENTFNLLEIIFLPFKIESHMKLSNLPFDGIVHLYDDADVIFEIKTSNINQYTFDTFKEIISKINLNKTTYFILISPKNPNIFLTSAAEENKYVSLKYIDFNTLIKLFEFVNETFPSMTKKDKIIKKFFFEKLFESESIINENEFNISYKYARNKINNRVKTINENTINDVIKKYEYNIKKSEDRISIIEEKLLELLRDIKQLKEEINSK